MTAPRERDERGWAPAEYGNGFERQTRGSSTDVSIDFEDMEVRIDEGYGYSSQSCTTYIPVKYVVEMLRRIGYRVSNPPCPNYEARIKCDCMDCISRRADP